MWLLNPLLSTDVFLPPTSLPGMNPLEGSRYDRIADCLRQALHSLHTWVSDAGLLYTDICIHPPLIGHNDLYTPTCCILDTAISR